MRVILAGGLSDVSEHGIVYYAEGPAVCTTLAVALGTQLAHSPGVPTCIVHSNVPRWFLRLAKRQGIQLRHTGIRGYWIGFRGRRGLWCRKPAIVSKKSPFRYTLMLDADVSWHNQLPEKTWDILKEFGIGTGTDYEELCHKHKGRQITPGLSDIFGVSVANDNVRPVRGCCVGFDRTSPKLDEWLQNIKLLGEAKRHYICRVPDEYALSAMVQQGKVGHLGYNLAAHAKPSQAAVIIHYGAKRVGKNPVWRAALNECLSRDDFQLRSREAGYRKLTPSVWRKVDAFSVPKNR